MVLLKKMTMMSWLKKVNAIDTSKLVSKTEYNAKIKDIEDKIPSIINIATTPAGIRCL